MTRPFDHLAKILLVFVGVLLTQLPAAACAQEEIPPPAGKGRLVVVVSGQSGPDHYRPVAQRIAALGYDVALFEGKSMVAGQPAALRAGIAAARRLPHALPGKVGLVGFSLGGGIVLVYGPAWGDQVAAVAVWYPVTFKFVHVAVWAAHLAVPVAMFAGEADTWQQCCLIGKAHELADAAAAAKARFTLTTYPGIDHDFVVGGSHYDSRSFDDAFARTAALLAQTLGEAKAGG